MGLFDLFRPKWKHHPTHWGTTPISALAAGMLITAAFVDEANASWVDDGCTTPSVGAIGDLAGNPDTDDHLVVVLSDLRVYLKNAGAPGYTEINSILENYDSYYGEYSPQFLPASISGDRVLLRDVPWGNYFEVSLTELRAGTIVDPGDGGYGIVEYDGCVGSSGNISDGRACGTTCSDHYIFHEHMVGSDPVPLFYDPTGVTLGATLVDFPNDMAYGTVYQYGGPYPIREYTGISVGMGGTVAYNDLNIEGFLGELISEAESTRGFRTLIVVDFEAVSGGDICFKIETSYPTPADDDGDGHTTDTDCDDADPDTYPEAPELCDQVDNDCDGDVDEDVDEDVDGDGWNECQGDCDNDDPDIHPGAAEVCDDADTDCDGVLPDDEADADGDGWSECAGDCDDASAALTPDDEDADGISSCEGDCDDQDNSVLPGVGEVCDDGVDNNCDGLTDDEDGACAGDDDDMADDDDASDDDDHAADDDSGEEGGCECSSSTASFPTIPLILATLLGVVASRRR